MLYINGLLNVIFARKYAKKTAGSSKDLEISPRSLGKIAQQMVGLVPNVLLAFIKQPILQYLLRKLREIKENSRIAKVYMTFGSMSKNTDYPFFHK